MVPFVNGVVLHSINELISLTSKWYFKWEDPFLLECYDGKHINTPMEMGGDVVVPRFQEAFIFLPKRPWDSCKHWRVLGFLDLYQDLPNLRSLHQANMAVRCQNWRSEGPTRGISARKDASRGRQKHLGIGSGHLSNQHCNL